MSLGSACVGLKTWSLKNWNNASKPGINEPHSSKKSQHNTSKGQRDIKVDDRSISVSHMTISLGCSPSPQWSIKGIPTWAGAAFQLEVGRPVLNASQGVCLTWTQLMDICMAKSLSITSGCSNWFNTLARLQRNGRRIVPHAHKGLCQHQGNTMETRKLRNACKRYLFSMCDTIPWVDNEFPTLMNI